MNKSYQEQIIESVLESRHSNGIEYSPLLVIMDCFAVGRLEQTIGDIYNQLAFNHSEERVEKYKTSNSELETILKKYNIKPAP